MAAIATFALKAGLSFRPGRFVMVAPRFSAIFLPISSGFTTQRPVQFSRATSQLRLDRVAKLLGLSVNTLKKYYGEELDLGLARANAVVSGTLFTEAKRGNVTAAIFWMKWRTT